MDAHPLLIFLDTNVHPRTLLMKTCGSFGLGGTPFGNLFVFNIRMLYRNMIVHKHLFEGYFEELVM